MKYIYLIVLLSFVFSCNAPSSTSKTKKTTTISQSQNFHTDGNAIRNIQSAKIDGKPVFYISELDGAVSCYTTNGEKLWNNKTESQAILFEIEAADIDNDGNDELVAASGDGHIYCWNDDGKLLWKFAPKHKVRFSEVAILKTDKVQIFAGGNDYKLYELDEKGELVSATNIKGVVRTIEVGNFLETEKPSVFVMTYSHDKFRWRFFGFINPTTKKVEKSIEYANKKHKKNWSRFMVTDTEVADINKDKIDDLLFYGDLAFQGQLIATNSDCENIAMFKAGKKTAQRYAHGIGTTLLPYKDEIVYRHGSVSYRLNLKGELIEQVGKKYKNIVYHDIQFEPMTKRLVGAGEVGIGNAVYQYDLSKSDWLQTEHEKIGRSLEVDRNMAALYTQVLAYKMPSYQEPTTKPWLMVTKFKETPEVQKLKGNEVKYITQYTWSENFDRKDIIAKIGKKEATKKDRRKKYQLTQTDILEKVEAFEAAGKPFILWTGHGTDPFYVSIETMEKILEIAPTTCYGFLYAEMHASGDPRADYFADEYMPRLAKAIRKHNQAKIFFRNKNMFWAATSHIGKWKDIFFSGKYKDIVVPASEDTSSRTQDVNFSGRVGMFAGGYVDDFAIRLIDDNPTSWRPLTPGGQRSVSPFLRQGVMLAAYGSRTGVLSNSNFIEKTNLNVFFAMMKTGVLPMVEKEDILSIGSWHLMQEIDDDLIHSVDNHHKIEQYSKKDDNAVFSVAQMHWAGTNIPDYDYSKFMGVNYRWTNYMPEMPYGMIPVAPIDSKATLEKSNTPFAISNMKNGIVNGEEIPAKKFGATMKTTAEAGAKKLPILVSGASWSAIRLDENHIRVILVDPHYLNPQKVNATITFQRETPKSVTDILSKENLKINKNTVELVIPAGSMRFIDLEM